MRGTWVMCLVVMVAACGSAKPNQPPELDSFQLATVEDQPVMANVAAGDPDGDELTLDVLEAPGSGSVVITGLTIVYTPELNFNGPDAFQLVVSDGTAEVVVAVTVNVSPANDQPTGGADTLAALEDMPRVIEQVALLQNDSDIDGDALALVAVGNAVDGTVAIAGADVVFTPALNFEGNASFTYTLSDGTASFEVDVTVMVGGINDAPVAVDDNVTTDEDTLMTLTTLQSNDVDVEAQTLSITSVANATNGTVTLVDAVTVSFTPSANFNGSASFEYTVSDGVDSDTGLVTITVNAVNDPPVAVDDTASTTVNVSRDLTHAALLANDADGGDGGALTITAVQNAQNGTATLNATTITFTPTANFIGTASFEYVVSDGGDTDVGAVTVTVVDAAPVARCADILSSIPVWGLASTGVDLRAFTNSTLHWIGCAGNISCPPSSFYCIDTATSLQFGTTALASAGVMRALVDPGNAAGDTIPPAFSDCCSAARPTDVCNAPDSASNNAGINAVDALCRALGYSTGTILRQVNTNFCPKPHPTDVAGLAWTSSFVDRDGAGAEYRCDL